jgi:hypothetical protein
LVLDRLELKLPAERAKDAEAPWDGSTLEGVLLSRPDGFGLGFWREMRQDATKGLPGFATKRMGWFPR